MAAKLDPTQEKILDNVRHFGTVKLCNALRCSPQQLSDYRACRRVLAPWQLKRLVAMAADARPVVAPYTDVTGQSVSAPGEAAFDAPTAARRVVRAFARGLDAVAEAAEDGDFSEDEWATVTAELEAGIARAHDFLRTRPKSPQVPVPFPAERGAP